MTGLITASMTSTELREASVMGKSKTQKTRIQAATPYVWDGEDEDDRPLTHEEMQAGIEAYRRQRGRPTGSDKESTTYGLIVRCWPPFAQTALAGKPE